MSDERTTGIGVAFHTHGCKVNRVEAEEAAADLVGRGARLADDDDAAVVVINTCTVTAEADAKARKAVRQALKATHRPVVVVTGCLAAINRPALEALGDRVVVEADKTVLASRIAELVGLAEVPGGRGVRAGAGFRTRALLKVEDGCDNFCAYCIVPHARGVPRATPLAEIVADAKALVAAGVREVVLTGINIGRYADAVSAADLAVLVEAVAASGVERIRLSSIEPPDLTDRLLKVLASTPAACPHLHVPLQSGSDEVLSAMRRRYTAEEYAERISAARTALPGLAVTTDVLVGFPGETGAQADETRAFCERVGFSKLHVFRYSPRPGTPAAEMPGQVAPAEKSARAASLRAMGDELRARYGSSRVGGTAEVLVEKIAPAAAGLPAAAEGTSGDFLRVRLPATGLSAGEVVRARLLGTDGAVMLGEVLS